MVDIKFGKIYRRQDNVTDKLLKTQYLIPLRWEPPVDGRKSQFLVVYSLDKSQEMFLFSLLLRDAYELCLESYEENSNKSWKAL